MSSRRRRGKESSVSAYMALRDEGGDVRSQLRRTEPYESEDLLGLHCKSRVAVDDLDHDELLGQSGFGAFCLPQV
jgi:hypothetical protein